MPTIEIDVAGDEDHDTLTRRIADRHNCSVKLLKEIGPGGGNPLYLFTGTRRTLTGLIKDFYQDIDTDYHVSRIQD